MKKFLVLTLMGLGMLTSVIPAQAYGYGGYRSFSSPMNMARFSSPPVVRPMTIAPRVTPRVVTPPAPKAVPKVAPKKVTPSKPTPAAETPETSTPWWLFFMGWFVADTASSEDEKKD